MKVVDHLESKECAVKKILIDVVREEASLSKVVHYFKDFILFSKIFLFPFFIFFHFEFNMLVDIKRS